MAAILYDIAPVELLWDKYIGPIITKEKGIELLKISRNKSDIKDEQNEKKLKKKIIHPAYEKKNLIAQERIFADNYQFYIYDSKYDHLSNLDWDKSEKLDYNYRADEKAIWISTAADLNNHRVRVFKDIKPKKKDYMQYFEHELNISSGKLHITDKIKIALEKKKYKIYICSNSIGDDRFNLDGNYDKKMSDQKYFKHDEFEYYDVFITEDN